MQTWMWYMIMCCIAAFGVGYIAAWAIDEWKHR